MVALILGLSLGGLLGMLLAVPGLAVMKIIFVHYYETRVLGHLDYYSVRTGEGLIKEPGEKSEIHPEPEDARIDTLPPPADARLKTLPKPKDEGLESLPKEEEKVKPSK
jgi:hypothetical protein